MAVQDHLFWLSLDELCRGEHGQQRRAAWERIVQRGLSLAALREVVTSVQRCCGADVDENAERELTSVREWLEEAWKSVTEAGDTGQPSVLEYLEGGYYRNVFPLRW